jgi:hypothetical protein
VAESNTPERRIRIDLPVFDELDRGEALRIEDSRKRFYGGGSTMNAIRLFVAPHEEMDEARRVFAFLPHFIAKGSRLVRTNVRYELVDRSNDVVERIWSDLIPS